jgi:hypothetical protein
MPCTNVFVIEGDFHYDRRFQSQIRGLDNLRIMVKKLAGVTVVDSRFRDKYLTPLQVEQWDMGLYCTKQDDRDDQVHGLIKRGDRYRIECRCYQRDCPSFERCRAGFDPDSGRIIVRPPTWKSDDVVSMIQAVNRTESDFEESSETATRTRETTFEFENEPDFSIPVSKEIIEKEEEDASPISKHVRYDQDAIIKGDPQAQMLVIAGPGTGKTHSLIEKLKYLVDQSGTIEAEDILVLCFMRTAVREVRDRLRSDTNASDDLSRIEICTFDSFATRVLVVCRADLSGKDYDKRIQMAIEEIGRDPGLLQNMKHFIVDEIQDLVGVRARLVQTILMNCPPECGFTLLGDNLQGIFDYQIVDKENELDAEGLLGWIGDRYADSLQVVRLSQNYRQGGDLAAFSAESRKQLEIGGTDACKRFISNISGMRRHGRDYSFNIPDEEGRNMAILCRTNGEALKMSANLRKRGIDHSVRRRQDRSLFPVWIADLLLDEGPNISYERFSKFLEEKGSRLSADSAGLYETLNRLCRYNSGHLLNLGELRDALASGARIPDELYEEGHNRISVGTIHQSKGREYDTVMMLEPSLRNEDDPRDEAKVYYVAITRARNLFRLLERSKRTWLKRSEIDNRWLELIRRNGKTKLAYIEIGLDNDVDEEGFVDQSLLESPSDNQEFIRNALNIGDQITICREEKGYKKQYIIYHGQRRIGRMSDFFTEQIRRDLGEVYGHSDFSYDYMPISFDDVYVERIYSVVKHPETILDDVPEPYSSVGVWYGVHLIGLGKANWKFD